ncbi:MAG TPA: response regulator [Geobacteraceae bacterium]
MNTVMQRGDGREDWRPTVLIIDDDPNNLAIVADYLESNNFTMLAAEDGESGLNRALYARPDLILLDVMMASADGYETCRRLKSLAGTRDIPVIFMTALSETEHKIRGFEAGAVDYITKPFEREELLARVGVHLRIRELTNRLEEANEFLEKRVAERTAELAGANWQLRAEIAERRQVEEALRDSEAKFRTLTETSLAAVIVYREKILYVNPATEVLTGYGSDEMQDMALWEIVHPECQEIARERALARLAGEELPSDHEYRILRKDGEERWVNFSAKAFQYGGRGAWLGIFNDITDRKNAERERERLQQQLRQAQKMEAIGSLAGGIAHDFNNILTAILGYGHLLKKRINDDKGQRYLDEIIAASERAASLTQSLLTFSRKQEINLQPVNINKVVRKIENLLARLIGEEIELKTMLADESDMTILADSGQIEQVLMNLATNARDAMPDGGVLSIRTERVVVDGTVPGILIPTGLYNVIRISDTGSGMDEETRERIFEPFFTTKEPGKGTGLGLAIVHGIIKQHKGDIFVSSEEGCGTTFEIYLSHHDLKSIESQPLTQKAPVGGKETILIAEDDPSVRSYIKMALEASGYNVIVAEDGYDAVVRFRENGARIQLIILDVIMPKKTGKAAFEEIRKIDGQVPVIFWSGYPTDFVNKKGITGKDIPLLAKPVAPHLLLAKIREALTS